MGQGRGGVYAAQLFLVLRNYSALSPRNTSLQSGGKEKLLMRFLSQEA